MSKIEDEPPVQDEGEDAKPTRTRRVIADKKLGIANDIMRMLSEVTETERKAVMQIVNILVDTPSPSEESE